MLDSTVVCRRALGCEWGGNACKAAFCNELRKQCRHLVPFLFGDANPNPNQRPTAQLRPTWLAIVAGRARPDEPEVVGGVQGW